MSAMILISTHRIQMAGRIREAVEARGHRVDLLTAPDQLDLAPDARLLILTGPGPEGEHELRRWVGEGAGGPRLPFFTVLPGDDAIPRGRALGADEAFPERVDPEAVARSAHQAMERERLRELTGIVGRSEGMREVLQRVVQIAPAPSTVLITGESGTGKELVARGIHLLSPRRPRAFLAVNVAALSEGLLESELFGHEKGAFTGAVDSRKGFFELAHEGSLFLDEIGEMPLATQTKLLRVLERGEFLRVGGERPREVDVRIIAATNRDLRAQVAAGEFRRDLYYRLNVLGIELPPLRRRSEDIPVLVAHFIEEIASRMDRAFPGISPRTMAVLQAYDWPGNVRELRNLVESMVVLAPNRVIEPEDLPREIRFPREASRLLPPPATVSPGPPREEGHPGGGRGRERATFLGLGRPGVEEISGPLTAGRAGERVPGDGVGTADSGTRAEEGDPRLRPELELVFRTLLDLRMDMDQLRREFEAYREDMESRLEDPFVGSWILPGPAGVEVGYARRRARGEPVPGTEAASHTELRSTEEERDPPPVAEDRERGGSAPDGGDGPDGAVGRLGEDGSAEAPEGTAGIVFRPGMTMDELEAEAIRLTLEETGGNRREAAERLGIGERTLYRKIKKYEIDV